MAGKMGAFVVLYLVNVALAERMGVFVVAWMDGAADLEQWHLQVGTQEQMNQERTPAGAVQRE